MRCCSLGLSNERAKQTDCAQIASTRRRRRRNLRGRFRRWPIGSTLCVCALGNNVSARRTMRSHCLPWIHSLAGSAPFASARARARATCCWLISSSISAARICHSLAGRSQATLSLDCATNSLIQNDSDKLQDRKTKAAPIRSQHATSNNNHRRRGHTCQVRKQIMRRRRLRSTH